MESCMDLPRFKGENLRGVTMKIDHHPFVPSIARHHDPDRSVTASGAKAGHRHEERFPGLVDNLLDLVLDAHRNRMVPEAVV